MGGEFASGKPRFYVYNAIHTLTKSLDGRFQGNESIQTVVCDSSKIMTCPIKVPAPGFALVFLSQQALSESEPTSTMTFATTVTRTATTATIDASVLATAQGQSGRDRDGRHATSRGSSDATSTATVVSSTTMVFFSLLGFFFVWL